MPCSTSPQGVSDARIQGDSAPGEDAAAAPKRPALVVPQIGLGEEEAPAPMQEMSDRAKLPTGHRTGKVHRERDCEHEHWATLEFAAKKAASSSARKYTEPCTALAAW